MKKVTIYTDGACSYNPGPGGWGAILMFNGVSKAISGGEKLTTNNRMELLAVISALKMLKERCDVQLYSDSAYLVNAFNQNWLNKWQANGWKSGNKAVKNIDLWQELLRLSQIHQVKFIKVKGHSDNEFNNECDRLARAEVEKLLKE